MRFQRYFGWVILLTMLSVYGIGALQRPSAARAAPPGQVSAYELILAMNTLS